MLGTLYENSATPGPWHHRSEHWCWRRFLKNWTSPVSIRAFGRRWAPHFRKRGLEVAEWNCPLRQPSQRLRPASFVGRNTGGNSMKWIRPESLLSGERCAQPSLKGTRHCSWLSRGASWPLLQELKFSRHKWRFWTQHQWHRDWARVRDTRAFTVLKDIYK